MIDRHATEELLVRLKREREEADRAYNDLLTAVDCLLRVRTPFPAPPADAELVHRINQSWQTADYPAGGGRLQLRRRLFGLSRFFLGDHLDRQQAFNASVVAYVNETHATAGEIIKALQAHLDKVTVFESTLVQYFQTITLYVDTKDRDVAGEMRSVLEGAHDRIDALFEVMDKRYESFAVRGRRVEAEVGAVGRELEQLRDSVALVNQLGLTLKRALERLAAPVGEAASGLGTGEPVGRGADLNAFKYLEFENRFRGSREEIRNRLKDYLPLFAGASDVVDLGCGRGEFLDLLREAGVPARGVDTNDEMVQACVGRGLTATVGDALSHLEAQRDGSLGGLFAAQVVEHLEPGYLMRLLEVAYHKLRPGSRMVLETINPRCWFAFFESFIRDLSHVKPIHPETLSFLLQASGFQQVEVRYRAPYSDLDKLQPVAPALPETEGASDITVLRDVVEVVNANVEKLNRLLFSYLDYAAIARRL